ncbi:MAG: hypothetical protein JOZ15_02395 [Acidobacteria bacterium]|nr:hypothetical protein [Acidobacteriota bacterium]
MTTGSSSRGGALRRAAACVAAAALGAAGTAAPAGAGLNVWTAAGPNGGQVVAMAPAFANPRLIYAATAYGGIFKSSDGGASWQAASRGLADHQMLAVAVDPRDSRTVYASSLEGGIAVSHDGAATWTSTAPLIPGANDYAISLAVDPAHAATVYAADVSTVWVSHDGGASWTQTSLQIRTVGIEHLVADPVRSSVYAFMTDTVNAYYLLETADGGLTWTDHSPSLPGLPLGSVNVDFAIEPAAPGTLYIGLTRTEVDTGRLIRKTYRSSDGGASWQGAGTGGFPLAAASGLVISGGQRSADHGVTWSQAATPPDTVGTYAISADGSQIYAGGAVLGVLASADGGRSWRVANQGLTATPVLALAVDPQTPGTWYAAPFRLPLEKSRNSGRHWRALGVSDVPLGISYCCPPSYGATVAVAPAAPATVFYSTGGYLFASMDGGASWRSPGPDAAVTSLIVDPASPTDLYAVGSFLDCNFTFGRSTDGGVTWSCLPFDPYEAVLAPKTSGTLYALALYDPSGRVLFRSADAGASWTPIDAGLPLVGEVLGPPFAALHMAVDPTDAGRLYVSGPSGVWMTPDGGAHWNRRSGGLPHAATSPLLAIDANDPSLLYAAAGSIGVYRSRDGGMHWQPILAGLPPIASQDDSQQRYTAVVADPTRPGSVYLATLGNGVLAWSSQ